MANDGLPDPPVPPDVNVGHLPVPVAMIRRLTEDWCRSGGITDPDEVQRHVDASERTIKAINLAKARQQ